MPFSLKVGNVLHDNTNILVNENGKPKFTGQTVLPTETVLRDENLPYYYPIIPELFNDDNKKEEAFRYYGYLDLDMDMDEIESGEVPLISDHPPKVYKKKDHIKKELAKWLQTEGVEKGKTFEEMCICIPAMNKVCEATRVVVEDLKQKGIEAIPFFSGLKGTRVLWYDESLWRKVPRSRKDSGDAGVDLLKSYFSKNVLEALKQVEFDASVYGFGKGLKPDMLPHPYSKIAPLPLFDPETGNWSVDWELTQEPVGDLTMILKTYWTHVFTSVKEDAPLLTTGITKYLVKRTRKRKSRGHDHDMTNPQKRDQKNTSKPLLQTRVEGLMELAIPGCSIHVVKDGNLTSPGLYIVVLTSNHKYCHIRQLDHSHNKSYYLVDTVRGSVKQKCHSNICMKCSPVKLWPQVPYVSDEDLAYFEYHIKRSDLGLASMFVRVARDEIVVVDARKGGCYTWNPKSALWDERDGIFCQNMISYRLNPIFDAIVGRLHDELSELEVEISETKTKDDRIEIEQEVTSLEDKIKTFERTREELLKTCRIGSAFSQAKTMLYDPDFIVNKLYRHLLPIADNKVVDLRDGSVSKRTKVHRFTFASKVRYDGNLKQSTTHSDAFFTAVMSNDKDKLEYFRTQLGYCLTGEMSSRCFFLWWGCLGRNAKGTVAGLMKCILGKFYAQISKGAAIDAGKKSDVGSATPHLVPLIYARLAMLSETKADDRISEDLVKTWTGNDPIKVRKLFSEEIEIETHAKLVIQTNNKPSFSGHQSMLDRTHLIQFGARFTETGEGAGETKADSELVRKFMNISRKFSYGFSEDQSVGTVKDS